MKSQTYTINGVEKTLVDWCDFYGVERKPVYHMVYINGTDIETAIKIQLDKPIKDFWDIIESDTDCILYEAVKGKAECAKLLGMKVSEVDNLMFQEYPKYTLVKSKKNTTRTDKYQFPPELMARWDATRKRLNPNAV